MKVNKNNSNIEKVTTIVLIVLLILLSLAIKFKDLDKFTNPDNFLTTHDAFRYARHSIELSNGTYSKIDYLANVPDYGINQYPPPLLISLAVWLHKVLNIQIQYVFLILPPILSILFVLPLYLWIKPFKNNYVLLGAISLGIFNLQYFLRTHIGYFDTDCMILFFVFLILFLINKVITEKENVYLSYFYISFIGLSLHIFMWWYDRFFFVFILMSCFVIGLIVWQHSYRHIIKKTLFLIVIMNPIEICYHAFNNPIYHYLLNIIYGAEATKEPINFFASISELQPVSIKNFISHTTDNIFTVLIGLIFFVLFFIKNFRYMIIASPFIGIGLMSFFAGYRYLIYLGPFLGIGIGYGIYTIVSIMTNKTSFKSKNIHIIGLILVVFLTISGQRILYEIKPLLTDRNVNDFVKLKNLTEENAYIWTWWDMGNPIQYLSNRAMYIDNTHFHSYKAYAIIKSLVSYDEDFTFKIISFFTNHKSRDYANKHWRFVEKEIPLYDEKPNIPVYVLLSDRFLDKRIVKNSSLDKDEQQEIEKRIPSYVFECAIKEDNTADCEDLIFSFRDNNVNVIDKNIKKGYKKIAYYDKNDFINNKVLLLNPSAKQSMYLILTKGGSFYQILAHDDFEKTMIFRMLISSEDTFRHFELVYEDFPYMVLYRVK